MMNKKIVIFSGTTEGRILSEELDKRDIPHVVFVATQYGELLQPSGKNVTVIEGRKDLDEIREYIKDADLVIDTTHPDATLVTENIKTAADECKVRVIRVRRDDTDNEYGAKIRCFDDVQSCAKALIEVSGNILLTTGSKNLVELCEGLVDKEKVYARILPAELGLKECEKAGIRSDHIIAMQGPFSKELNRALIRQYDIDVLVTKDSGKSGGFDEKLSACEEEGTTVFCIKRPVTEDGVSVSQALDTITSLCGRKKKVLKINIIGMGMGAEEILTAKAQQAVKRSDVAFGARRLIEGLTHKEKYPEYLPSDITLRLGRMLSQGRVLSEVSVLYSGDISFFSGAFSFEQGLKEWASKREEPIELEINRYPGISSVSFLAARLGVKYDDALIISLHGRNANEDIDAAASKIAYNIKAFVLLSSADDLGRLAKALLTVAPKCSITVAENLSYDDESIETCSVSEAQSFSGKGLYTLFVKNDEPVKKFLIPYICDEELSRNKTPMTKELIRHECVRLLQLKDADVLYDIGCGTGSVAIEAARLSSSLRVYAFEKKREAIEILQENLLKFNAWNVSLVEGEAPDYFEDLEAPDAVFIGGTGGRLQDILRALVNMKKQMRVVMTAISLESISEIISLGSEDFVNGLEIRQITGSKAVSAGNYNLMKTDNTVMIADFTLKG